MKVTTLLLDFSIFYAVPIRGDFSRMLAQIRGAALLMGLAFSPAATAQDLMPDYSGLDWTLEEYQTRCIPFWPEDALEDLIVDGGCVVGEFGNIVELDGFSFYYALYNDDKRFLPEHFWPEDGTREELAQSLRDAEWITESTALALLQVDSENSERATVFHLRKQSQKPASWIQTEIFSAPELIETDAGLVIYLRGFGYGDGMLQYRFDEYFLWRGGDWVRIDPHSWLGSSRERLRLPPEYSLHGISNIDQALPTLTYDASVWGPHDADCCPRGGKIRIYFEWEGMALRISSFKSALYRRSR